MNASRREDTRKAGSLPPIDGVIIDRNAGVVRRPSGPAAAVVHALLAHLEREGFDRAPKALGFDAATGSELLTYVEGEVAEDPAPAHVWTTRTLTDAGLLLRRFHDASIGFHPPSGVAWPVPCPRDLHHDVICHNDFAPYNAVFRGGRLAGMIDFELAAPGARIWDLAYTAYRFVPLSRQLGPPELRDPAVQATRLARLCAAYRLSRADRALLAPTIIRRVKALRDLIIERASAGDPVMQAHVERGDATEYDDDLGYLASDASPIQDAA